MSEGSILVCVDGSDYTEPSLLHATWLADRVGASKIIVSHIADVGKYQLPIVNELGAGVGLQPCNGLFSEIHKQEQDLLEDLSRRVGKVLGETNWKNNYEFVVERGRPAEALHPDEGYHRYSHVVFGKRGESFSADRENLGSNLGKFLKESPVSCLLSSRGFQPINEIALVLVPSQEWRSVIEVVKSYQFSPTVRIKLLHGFGNNLPAEVEGLISSIKSNSCGIELLPVTEDRDDEIAKSVCSYGVDMLVVGAHRERHFFQWLSSPVGKSIIKDCRIPILVCR